jgi:hypothetical protein
MQAYPAQHKIPQAVVRLFRAEPDSPRQRKLLQDVANLSSPAEDYPRQIENPQSGARFPEAP